MVCAAIHLRNSQHLFTVQHATIGNRKPSPSVCTHVTFVSHLLLMPDEYAIASDNPSKYVESLCIKQSKPLSTGAAAMPFMSTSFQLDPGGPSFRQNIACLSTFPTKGQSAEQKSVQFSWNSGSTDLPQRHNHCQSCSSFCGLIVCFAH